MECFAERGFDGTSIRMIADHAKRPLSLLSHYFGNKENLYLEVFKWILTERQNIGISDTIPETGYNPRNIQEALFFLKETLKIIYTDAVNSSDETNPFLKASGDLFLRELRSPRPCLHSLLFNYMAPRTESLRRCIQIIRPDLNEDMVIFLGISIIGQVVCHGLMRGFNSVIWENSKLDLNHFQSPERLVDLSLHGLMNNNMRQRGDNDNSTQMSCDMILQNNVYCFV